MGRGSKSTAHFLCKIVVKNSTLHIKASISVKMSRIMNNIELEW